MEHDIHAMRQSYGARTLLESVAPDEPITLFSRWFADAVADPAIVEANALTLSTVAANGTPRARTVLLKSWGDDLFVFYTNYDSDKAREIAANAHVAMSWLWLPHERQVRLEGVARKTSSERSDAYFRTRPRLSQLGAWASAQSREVSDRAALEERFRAVQKRFEGQEIPRPPNWGGYSVAPARMEFWQGRVGRMHDRLVYTRKGSDAWERHRLMP